MRAVVQAADLGEIEALLPRLEHGAPLKCRRKLFDRETNRLGSGREPSIIHWSAIRSLALADEQLRRGAVVEGGHCCYIGHLARNFILKLPCPQRGCPCRDFSAAPHR